MTTTSLVQPRAGWVRAPGLSAIHAYMYRNSRWWPFLLVAPCLLWIGIFFILPLVLMSWKSLSGGGLSVAAYHEVLTSPHYLRVLWNTTQIVTITTMSALVLGYPVAYVLTTNPGWIRGTLLVLVSVPYWVDVIVRSFSWLILLGDNGVVNKSLIALGLVSTPIPLLYNRAAVVVGMVQILLPMMIITLFGAMTRIDRSLIRAAKIHGADDWRAFWYVFLPLSLPGVYGACLLTLVLGLGFYVTPALLGSPKETMITQTIMIEANENLDYEVASAAAMLLLVVTLALVMIYNRYFSLDRLWGGGRR